MNKPGPHLWDNLQKKWISRRGLMRGAAGAALGGSLLRSKRVYASDDDGHQGRACGVNPNPIPGGVGPFAPLGTFIHHNPLKKPLSSINDPSQITDFDGFVGLTHIRGGGSGTGGTRLAFQADMGFSRGKFISTDGREHHGTFAFV